MRQFVQRHSFWSFVILIALGVFLWLIFAVWPEWLEDAFGRKKTFVNTFLNGLTLAGLYFLVTIGISIIAADLMLAFWSGTTYQFNPPEWLIGAAELPVISALRSDGEAVYLKYPLYRLTVLGVAVAVGIALWLFLNRTRVGMMIRAGVNDRGMLAATGVNVQLVFALVFAIGAGLAGFAGVVGGTALSIAPGEDIRYLLASLVVVIVGGLGSVTGAAIGALLIGLAEQFGLAYFPTYGVVLTFLIMVVVLAVRPQGVMGQA
jgi:branched-chain amino acid transport system permease protein